MIAPGTHKIANVSAPREWQSQQGGPMKSYTIKVEGDDGAYELSKKATSDAPATGQSIDVAQIIPPKEGTTFPPKIKLQFGANGGRGGGMTPEREAHIVRQHSQEMALRYAAIKATLGELPTDFKPSDLFKIADLFDNDAKAAKP